MDPSREHHEEVLILLPYLYTVTHMFETQGGSIRHSTALVAIGRPIGVEQKGTAW